MPWSTIRSRRDPAFWLPIVAIVVVLVPAVIWTHFWLQARADELLERAAADPEQGLAEAIAFARTLGWLLAGVTAAIGLALLHYFQLGLQHGRLPPPGWWSLGAFRVAVGDTARRMARFGRVVAVVLIAASLGLGLAVEHLIDVVERAAADARNASAASRADNA
ncbi:MAG: hypothetical protein ABFS41_04010 [Myxococcota bacterium]